MAKANQSKVVTLVFRTEDRKFSSFQLIGWKVRSHSVTQKNTDGTYTCNCAEYRFESDCEHVSLINNPLKKTAHGCKDWRNTKQEIKWHTDATPRVVVGDLSQGKGVPAQAAYEMGDLSLYSFVFALTEDAFTEEIQKVMDDPSSILNPNRLHAECLVSLEKGVAIINPEVAAAGMEVKPLTREDVPLEEDFDENLTNDRWEDPQEAPITSGNWRTTKRPDPKEFYVVAEAWEQILFTMENAGNVLIVGPSGSGKSELVYIAAKAMGMPLAPFNFGAMQEPRTTLIGATHFDKEKGTWFAESRFIKAIRSPRHCILLDELTRDRGASAHNIILPLLDRQGYLALDEHDDAPIIKKGSQVAFVATANVGAEYTGTEALDKALRDRMDTVIEMTWAPKQYEVKILMQRSPGLRAGDASKLVDMAIAQRNLAVVEMEFVEQISTRMLLSAGKRIGQGMSFDNAAQFSICNHFSSEGGDASERTKIKMLLQKGQV